MSTSPIATAIREWQEQVISGTQLMRQLVSFDKWCLLVSEAAAADLLSGGEPVRLLYSQDSEGVTRLYLFSGEEALNTFLQATGQEPGGHHVLVAAGIWVFTLPLESFDAVEIDPASVWQIGYRREQFPMLQAMAEAVAVERALADLRTGQVQEGAIRLVREYEHYLLPVFDFGEQGYLLALAPDDRGRALAAIFTASDGFDAYVQAMADMNEVERLISVEVPGTVLFEQLMKTNLDGLVFNCSGPTQPVAFALPFAKLMLESET
ncbi:MAG: hypothetical protein RMN24_14160 [Anaerolineae bacterium]|nr:hypothetical protein [Caldilineales bacterium]MCX7851920.1 hypothetical protein [Caldilineales bacterium]MDW8270300.1 hypothetical protein [Anaerolineae bacterium]